MRALLILPTCLLVALPLAQAQRPNEASHSPLVLNSPAQTATGIALDTTWKQQIYAFAVKNVVHPSWGLAHSERDYQVTLQLAQQEKIEIDGDVLFAAAFLHDLGGLAGFEKTGVDHAVRSVELAEPLLKDTGFPMTKWPQVKELIWGHTYYGPIPPSKAALAFRDADVLDFLGVMGAARILAVTREAPAPSPTMGPMIKTLQSFAATMSSNCQLEACRKQAAPLSAELQEFLRLLDLEALGGRAL